MLSRSVSSRASHSSPRINPSRGSLSIHWPRTPPGPFSAAVTKPNRHRSSMAASSASELPGSFLPTLSEDAAAVTDFAGSLPKSEIQASLFLDQHPQYDGRGVVIAIFDTGVDPGANGLQTTPDGRPKIIDVVDCTGSGDVDVSTVVKADENHTIESIHGTKLRVNPSWKNPSGEWHVGGKFAYELFPFPLTKRLKEDHRRRFDEIQRIEVTKATAALAAFDAEHGTSPTDVRLSRTRAELEARVKLLAELAEKYDDVGPWIDAVVWHDGERYMAALDTSEFYAFQDTTTSGADQGQPTPSGALEQFTPLTNYRDCRQFGTFSALDACNFAVNIYEAGRETTGSSPLILSIVVDAGSHGTHVAGIAAAYHPEDPSLNGIAPGAQIVSCKIGDTRLGSMETMTGLTRAFVTVLQNKCDLINMSYGEATSTPNRGRFIRLAEELVYKHDVIFVASAGNAGPALTTVGAPGGTSSAVLGIGAYVTPALAAAGHSLRSKLVDGGMQYTWSSRGPTADGDIGVNISAPGGAIAPVPQWSQQRKQLMNGTSMASPCACGGLALLVSALKAEGQPVTPARVRRAVENTALAVDSDDPASALTYGRGLLHIMDAWKYLQAGAGSHLDDVLRDLRLDVSVHRTDSAWTGRGILIREPADSTKPTIWSVEVKPGLKEDSDIKTARLEVDLKMRLEATASWVICPSMLICHHNGRSMEVEVDPTTLPEGLHYAEVRGYDTAAEWRGPVFRVPITVIKPAYVTPQSGHLRPLIVSERIAFSPGLEVRRFVAAPLGATWAELKLKSVEADTLTSYMIRATTIRPHTRYSDSEHRAYIQLPPDAEQTAAFAVTGGATLEITIAQFWSSLGRAKLEMELSFHGVHLHGGPLTVDGAGGPTKLYANAPFRREKVKPSAKLDTVRIPLRPTESQLCPLSSSRDELPGGRTIHRLVLTYKLSLLEGGKITPRLPLLNRYVYDGEIESQMYFICDENKKLLGVGDIYPDAVTLKKGEFTIRLALRHDDTALLERLRSLPMIIERKLESPVVVPVYATAADALLAKDVLPKDRSLCPGETIVLFLGPVPEDKLPKDAMSAPGRHLVGSFSLGQTSLGGNDAPGALTMMYLPPPKKSDALPSENTTATGTTTKDLESHEEALNEAVRDAQVKFLSQMDTQSNESRSKYEALAQDLLLQYPRHLPLLRERVKRLAAASEKKTSDELETAGSVLQTLIAAADAVLDAIDTTELAVYLARKCPEEGPEASKRKKDMEDRKAAVIEALAAKCRALEKLEALEIKKTEESGNLNESKDAFEAAYNELRRWVDPVSDVTHAPLAARREMRAGRPALALRALEKASSSEDKATSKETILARIAAFEAMGWGHWARVESKCMRRSFPVAYPTI